jgi:hypothetical protein
MSGKRFRITAMILFLMPILLLAPSTAGCQAEPDGPPGLSAEGLAVYRAARSYLDAELRRDLKAVYDHLAPSSVYCATHDYAAYLAEAEASPARIVAYRILNIAGIRDNEDRQAFPGVEKFARVEVDLKFLYVDTGQTAQVNFDFTFIREKGRWYKG